MKLILPNFAFLHEMFWWKYLLRKDARFQATILISLSSFAKNYTNKYREFYLRLKNDRFLGWYRPLYMEKTKIFVTKLTLINYYQFVMHSILQVCSEQYLISSLFLFRLACFAFIIVTLYCSTTILTFSYGIVKQWLWLAIIFVWQISGRGK